MAVGSTVFYVQDLAAQMASGGVRREDYRLAAAEVSGWYRAVHQVRSRLDHQ